MSMLTETAELQAFVQTVEARSLARAARELGVPRATLGRRLARVEERLGVRLLRRTTRRLALTDAGEELYRHARGVLAAVREAEAAVRRTDGAVRGLLRVSLPLSSEDALHGLLLDFGARYPDVRVEAQFSSHHVDLLGAGYDVGIRASPSIAPGLIARTLARVPLRAVASPAYLARAGLPGSPEELARHACIVGFSMGERPATQWPLAGGGHLRVEGVLATNDILLQREAARAGRGIALLPEIILRGDLLDGTLVPVLAGAVGGVTQVAVVYPERELLPPAVRAFVQFVVERGPSLFPSLREAPGTASPRGRSGGASGSDP
jgi:DNA-binding transcriptional LysR family regulator